MPGAAFKWVGGRINCRVLRVENCSARQLSKVGIFNWNLTGFLVPFYPKTSLIGYG